MTPDLKSLNELQLLRRAKRGGAAGLQAFSELVTRHQSWLVRLLFLLLRSDQGAAEDVAQETFLKTFAALDRIPDDINFRAWLRKVGTRLAYNDLRNASTRRRYTDQWKPPEPSPASAGVEAADALSVVLRQLPYSYSEILILRHVDEMTLEEIGELLELGLSATKMRLSRARRAFKELYTETMNNGQEP